MSLVREYWQGLENSKVYRCAVLLFALFGGLSAYQALTPTNPWTPRLAFVGLTCLVLGLVCVSKSTDDQNTKYHRFIGCGLVMIVTAVVVAALL